MSDQIFTVRTFTTLTQSTNSFQNVPINRPVHKIIKEASILNDLFRNPASFNYLTKLIHTSPSFSIYEDVNFTLRQFLQQKSFKKQMTSQQFQDNLIQDIRIKETSGQRKTDNSKILESIIFELAKCLNFIHSRKILHKNFNPDYILVSIDDQKCVKLKLSNFMDAKNISIGSRLDSLNFHDDKYADFNSLRYVPPEIFLGNRIFNLEYKVAYE